MTPAYSSLPDLVSLALALVAWNAFALLATFLTRACSRRLPFAGIAYSGVWPRAVGAAVFILLGFMIINLWNSVQAAQTNVDKEAAVARELARDAAPGDRTAIAAYVERSIAAWPKLCAENVAFVEPAALRTLERAVHPRSAATRSDLDRQFTTLEALQYERVRLARGTMPRELWTAAAVLSALLVVLLALTVVDPAAYHVILMIILATSLAMTFWIAALLDFPFCGSHAVAPAPLRDTLHALRLP